MFFQVQAGRLVTSQQKCNFFCLRFTFACRLVLYSACAVENPEISEFCVSKIRAVPKDYKRVKKILT